MTTPEPQAQPTNLNVTGTVIPAGPGGKPMAAITIQYGYSQHAIVLPGPALSQVAATIAQVCAGLAEQIRQLDTGLIIAQPGQIPPLNGHRP